MYKRMDKAAFLGFDVRDFSLRSRQLEVAHGDAHVAALEVHGLDELVVPSRAAQAEVKDVPPLLFDDAPGLPVGSGGAQPEHLQRIEVASGSALGQGHLEAAVKEELAPPSAAPGPGGPADGVGFDRDVLTHVKQDGGVGRDCQSYTTAGQLLGVKR
jgi:hypothetical protein